MTKRHVHAILTLLLMTVFPLAGYSEPAAADWRFDTGLTLNRFEQQIKTEVGGVRGERLVEAFEFGFSGIATHRIWGPLSGGLYARYDIGARKAGRFEGIENGRTVTTGETGGAYSELWFGPLVRAQWAFVFAELGYGLLGIRSDDARDDLPDEAGDTDNPLRTSKTVAWLLNLGGDVPINETVSLALRLEYRVRYYDRRDKPLVDKLVHGTQNFTPFIGIGWTPP